MYDVVKCHVHVGVSIEAMHVHVARRLVFGRITVNSIIYSNFITIAPLQ